MTFSVQSFPYAAMFLTSFKTFQKHAPSGFPAGPDLTLWGPWAPRHIGAPRKMKNEITVGENGYFDQSNRLSEERLDLRKYKPILTNYQVQLQTNPTSSSLNEDKNWYLAQINNLWGPLICGGPGHVPCWPAPKSGPDLELA